jgi:catechol 2,3-dioxygenase-like lactoylglutathione lyase family enzyme
MIRAVFDHLTVRVSDQARSRAFYSLVFEMLGRPPATGGGEFDEWNDFAITLATAERPRTTGLHVGFGARSRADVDVFWAAGIEVGYASDGEPGPRPQYSDSYYGAFLLDPDGNSVEAVYHGVPRAGDDVIDHVWIRVSDIAASRRFWEAVAGPLGLSVQDRPGGRIQVVRGDRSFALVQGDHPTRGLHLAFPADVAGVAAFHRAALAVGAPDHGAPGERPEYHPGYHAAFVLDPDGGNIEAVDHGGYTS